MKRINMWDMWEREWSNASKFFHSKGNVDTKDKLKAKWHNDFKKMLMVVESVVKENLKTSPNSG